MRLRLSAVFFLLALLLFPCLSACAEDEHIEPAWPVPDYVEHLLQVASEEVGYKEDHGRTKYGAWAGDAAAQWCAEFQCWCVDQVDQRWGTSLLRNVYPYYTTSNTGLRWFLRAGRYVVRKGRVEGWGSGTDTEHVALVEYCTRNTATGEVLVHVIEGNKPSAVARDTYELNSPTILGYGTVHDVADITMTFGNEGEKVRVLQERLSYLGFLDASFVTGRFGDGTLEAVKAYQAARGLRVNGIANMDTQILLEEEYKKKYENDPGIWSVVEDD